MKIGIVATLINADAILEFFIKYHISIGFCKIYLFFDGSTDLGVEVCKKYSEVVVTRNNQELQNKWRKSKLHRENYKYSEGKEVMARQILNVDIAIQMCLDDEIEWLLHIDIDELFYTGFCDARKHFIDMSQKGFGVISYINHEAVPEKLEIKNYFTEVSLFKKNFILLSEYQRQIIKGNFNDKLGYFYFYNNGKSAVRIQANAQPDGVHLFKFRGNRFFSTKKNKIKYRHTDALPSILHFACCGFNHFYEKYKTLGFFSDKWFDEVEIKTQLPCHILFREVVRNQNVETVKKFYSEVFLDRYIGKTDFLLEKDIFFRISL